MPDESELREDRTLTATIDLYYDLFVPRNAPARSPLLIAVHGYGAHKRYMMREARLVAPKDTVVVSIQGPHQHFRTTDKGYRTGFGWLTDLYSEKYIALHHRFIDRVIELLAADNTIDRDRIFLFGFSQACALNFRYALSHSDLLRGVIGVCGGAPGDLGSNKSYRESSAEALYLYGNDDEFYTGDQYRTNAEKLRAMFPNLIAKQYMAGHEITDEMRADIRAFLGQRSA